MDRRRRLLKFVPMTDDLETKQLLSTLLPTTKKTPTVDTSLNTLEQKQQRIARLPFYLDQIYPGRTIPASITTPLVADLTRVIGQLDPPGSPDLKAFNIELRKGQGTATFGKEAAQTLSAAFGAVLTKATASSSVVASLQADMKALTQYNVGSPSPGFITTNDYSTVLQTALGVGKPYSLTNVSVSNPIKNHNGSFTSQISIQVASNGFFPPSGVHPAPTGSVEIHEVVTSTVPGRTAQTKTTLVKTVKLTPAAAIQTSNYLQTQAVWSGPISFKRVGLETVSFYAKYTGEGRFTGSTSTTVLPA